MLRAFIMICLLVVFGVFASTIVLKILGGVFGITFWLVAVAIKLALVGGLVYLGIRVVSPDTARRLKDRWSETRVRQY